MAMSSLPGCSLSSTLRVLREGVARSGCFSMVMVRRKMGDSPDSRGGSRETEPQMVLGRSMGAGDNWEVNGEDLSPHSLTHPGLLV